MSEEEIEQMNDLYAWSTSTFIEDNTRVNTSGYCIDHLYTFFQDAPNLAIATEASSHPSGLLALEWQPWTWAGGGLGNIDECPLQTCIAGAGIRRDSLTFASLCVVPECTAHDLVAEDFPARLEKASHLANDTSLGMEYSRIVHRVAELNKFLGTGWICGVFTVPWTFWPFGFLFFAVASFLILAMVFGSCRRSRRRRDNETFTDQEQSTPVKFMDPETTHLLQFNDEGKRQDMQTFPTSTSTSRITSPSTSDDSEDDDAVGATYDEANETNDANDANDDKGSFWSMFDIFENAKELSAQKSEDTAILDGLRVGSICWIILGHLVAITGSVSGFSNPKEVYPPSGYLSTIPGQLVLSSKFAVDTFLIISGFLTFHVMDRKLPRRDNSHSVLYRYVTSLPKLIFTRAARILPLYAMILLFYTQVAPHLGGGPFWYQWLALLKPCHDYGWTNLLFINNFVPLGTPTTGTCFYHSWYLAVDMQLFILSTGLVFWHQQNPVHGKRATLFFWFLSLGVGMYLAAIRHWSINTFDGMAVALYDIEAYSKPHIRAQCYLTGVYVAMILPKNVLEQRRFFTWKHRLMEILAVACLAVTAFITYFGANSHRACQYLEWPKQSGCGSDWSETANWIYTVTSRTAWSLSIGIIMHLFLGRPASVSPVSFILSWKGWIPLSRLSFAVYLIHPILIFIWELGSTEKEVFRPITMGMNFVSVCVVSYLAALIAVLIVELPAANLWKHFSTRESTTTLTENSRPPSYLYYGSSCREHGN